MKVRERRPFVDNLWVVLVDGRQTAGVYSLMEQLMPTDSGPRVAHIHPIDEWFYVLEGGMTVEVGGETIVGRGRLLVDSMRHGP